MVSTRTSVTLLLALMIAIAIALPGVAAAADLARGEQLYDLCQQCHGASGEGDPMALAPSIGGLDGWYVESQLKQFQNGARGLHPEDVGGMRMSPMSRWLRSDADVAAVAAYVASLPRVLPPVTLTGGDLEKGKAFYATCAACHGVDGKGDQTKNAAPVLGVSDWYLLSTLQKYKAGIRGDDPANTNAVLMRGMSNILPDEQAMRDVVAYITTLGR